MDARPGHRPPSQPRSFAVRGLALFLGAFGAANALGGLVAPGFDANRIWIGVSAFAPWGAAALVGGGGAVLAAWAAAARPPRRLALAAAGASSVLACAAVADTVVVLRAHAADTVDVFPVPLSAAVAAGLAAIARSAFVARADAPPAASAGAWIVGVWAGVWATILPLALMVTLGGSVYRRPADAIVVLGARAYADGRASVALADRVLTGCRVWHEGGAPRLLLSGGPGDGAIHETEVMRRLAVAEGVDPSAIDLDAAGVDSRSTVRNSLRTAHSGGVRPPRFIVVSHAWHLPRLDLAFERRGAVAYTVPAVESRVLVRTPWFIVREVAAFWAEWAFGGAR